MTQEDKFKILFSVSVLINHANISLFFSVGRSSIQSNIDFLIEMVGRGKEFHEYHLYRHFPNSGP